MIFPDMETELDLYCGIDGIVGYEVGMRDSIGTVATFMASIGGPQTIDERSHACKNVTCCHMLTLTLYQLLVLNY